MTGLNRIVLHSSEFAATAKKKDNPSLNVTDQYNRYVSIKIYFIPRGSW